MKFSKEAIEEAAKLSKMSVGDYLDKLPSSFYEEAAKQSGFSNQEYLGKLKSIYSEPLKKKEDTQFGGTASANGTQNTSQSTSSSVLPSKNVSTPTNNIGQKIFNVNQAVQDLVYEKEDKPFFEKAKEPTPQVPLKQEQLKKKETPKEESRLVKVWSPTEKAYIYKLKEVQQSTSPESVVSVMTTQQILDATPETVKFRVNQGKNQEQLSFEQQSDKNNNVQAFNRESKYYTTYSKEIGKRIEDSEKVIKDKLGADFLGKLTKTSMSLNQTIATFNEYQKDKEKRANQLQTELTSIATKVKNGTLSKSDADYDFNLKREELEQIQNDLNQRVQNIKTIQDQLESYKNIPEVKSYILLNEKQNKVNEEARGLIFKDEYSEYRKTLDIASQKQFEKDTQKKEFLDKGFFGKVSDVLGAISNLSPVVLAEKLITGNKDKTYTGTAIKDESHRLMARTLNAIASYPKMAENTNPFGKADKYDFFDKIFDATTEFSKEKELTNQNASDVQRDIKQKYVEVDGYRVLLDDKGKPTKVTDDRFFNIGGLTQSLIINKYENNKDKYKDVKSDISVGTAVAKSVPTILDMGGLIALTTLTGGATAPLLGTEIAYGAATVASAAAQMYSGLYEGGIEAGLSPTEAGDFATVASLGVGSVCLVNPMEMSIAKNLMTRKVGKEIAEKMTKSEIQLVLNGKLKVTDLAIKYGKDYIKNTAGENLEEIVLEPFVQRGVEVLYNENAKKQGSGFEDLNEPFFNAKEVAETAIITSISTLLFSPIETASSIPNEKRLAVFKAIEKPNEFTEALNDKLEKGDITKERYDFEVKALEDVSNQYNSVKDNIKEKDKEKLTELLAKKYNLKKEISKINDDVLNRRNKSLLEDINKEIEGIITPTKEEEPTAKEQQSKEEVKTPTEEAEITTKETTPNDIEDKEYIEFINRGSVSEERLNDIANKVKNQEPLTEREEAIFSDKTSEINDILLKSAPQTATEPILEQEEENSDITTEEEKNAKIELANKLRSKAQEVEKEDGFDNEITVKDAIGKEVEFDGVKGLLKTNNENEVYIESGNKEILIGKSVDDKFYNSTAIDNGIQVLKPIPKPIIRLEEDNLTINGDNFKLESVNQDNNGNVVSVTVQDENGDKRTFRDADMAMDIAIAKNNQEFNKRSDGIIENNEQYQEVKTDIDKSIKEEHGESASDVIDNMPEEVLDTFLAMDSGVVELAPNELQQMVLNTSMWIDKSRKDIGDSNSTPKEKKEALSVLNKFENDLKKYYEKLEKARTGKTTTTTKSKEVESSTTDESEVKSKETDKQELKLVLNNLKIVEDENENEFANSKLTGESEIEQEPNVKAIENEGENVTNPEQAEKVLGKINDLTNNALDVVSVPISEIKTNEEEYQGRNNAFSERSAIETKQKQEVINKLRDVAEDIDNQGSLFSSTLPNSLKSKALNKVADEVEAGLSVEQAIDKVVKELATKEQSQSLKDFINDVINDNYTSTQSSKESTTRVTPNVSIEQQIEDFGIQDKGMVKAVSSVVQSLFNSLKKAGLVLHDSVEEWLGIGKSSLVDEKALKQIKDKAIKNGTFMKAPNGKPTNLNERQWLQVRTEQFKKWFGDFETLFNNDYLPNFGIFNNIYGKEKLQRLSEESERGRQESGSINAIATIITQRVQKSIQEEQGISRANAYSKTKQLEEQALTKYAKENGLIVALPSGDVVSDGNESDVYLNDNPNKVTKVTIPNNYNSWLELFDSIAIHNAENPNTQYEIKGFAINKDGEFSVVLEQNTIQGTPANFADIHNDLLNKGYELSGEYGDGRYIHKDKGIVLEDVKEDNVFTDGKNLFYIDTDYYPFDKQRGGDVKVGEAKLPIDESKVSKVVDENGEPLVVYHATNANFTEFKNQGDSGFFFSDSNDDIGHYGTNTMGVFINAPLLNMNTQVPYEFNKKGEITDDSFSYNNDVNNKYFSDIEAKKDTHKKSFNENNKQFTQYVIFNPNQIKSATDNVGTFSSESNNILFQQANAQFRIKSGQRIIEALKDFIKNPNKGVSAIIHEFMHPTVVEVFNGAKNGNKVGLRHANTIISEYNKAKGTNVTLEEMLSDNDKFINGTTTSKYRDVQEFIAESWEKYHYEGAKGFNKAFQQVLDAISRAFKEVYSNLTGIEVTPELRNMFDELLGKEVVEEIEQEKVEETTPTKETTKEQPTSKEETKVVSGKYNILERGKELVTEEQQSRTSKRANEAGVSDNKIATEKKDDSKFQSLASKIVDEALKNNNDDLLATVEDLKEQIEVEEINNLNLDTTTPSFNTLKVKIYGELLARAVALDDEVAKERIMDLYSKTLSSFGSGLGASSNDIMSNIKILDEIDYKVKQEQEVLLNLRTASGKTISDEISDIIGGLSKDVSDLINKALNETDSKINKAVNDIVAENKKETEPKKTFIPKDKKGKELIKSAFDELKKLYGGGNKLSFAIDLKRVAEEQFKVHKKTVQLLVQIGKGLIQEGVATIQNISDKIRDYIGRELGNAINFDDFKNEVLEKLNKQNKEKSIKSSNSEKLAEAIYNHNNKKDKPNKDKDIKEKIAEALILKYKADNKQGKPKSNRDILKEIAERVLNNDIADKLWDEAYIIASNKIDSDINLSEEEKQSQKDDLKEYIAKSKGSPFRDSEVREIVRNKFATDKDALRVKIRELAVSHFDDVNAEADSFVSRLMDETGLSYNQAETLFNAIKNEVKEIVARKAEQSLKAKDKRINDAKNNSKVKAEKPKTKIDNIVNDILRFGNIPQSRQGNYTSVLQHYGIPISNATAIRNLQQLAVIINSTSGVTQQNAQVVFQQILGQLEESPLARSKVFWNTLQNGFLANILGRGSVAIKSLFSTYIAGNWFRLQQSIVDLFSNYNGKVGLTDRVRFAFGNQRINKKVLDKLKNGFTDENGNFVMPSNQSQRSTNVLSRIANLFDVILRGNPQAKVWYEEADGMVEKELGSVFKDWKFSNALKKIYTLSMAMPVMLVRSLGAGDLFVREGVYNAQLSRIKGKEILKSGVKYGSKEYYEKLLVSLVQTEEVQNEITDIINKEEQALNRAGITMSEADKRRRRRELEAEKIGVESEVARIREEESIIAGMVSPMSEGLIKMLMTIQLAEFQKKIEGKRPDEIKASTIAIYNTLRLWNLFAKTLVPIVNIVTKSYIYGLKHVPIVGVGVHFTDKKVAQMIQKENYIEDKSDVSRMFVRQMLGLGMSSMLMSLLFEGSDDDEEEDGTLLNLQNKDVIFWGGYDKELAQNYPDKFRPNSLYYKGKLISFRDNPITLLLYPIGQITNSITKRDMYKNNPNSDGTPSDKYLQEREKTKGNGIERYIKSVLWNVPLYFKEMGTMQGIRDVLDILMGDEDWKIERAINKVTTAPLKATPLHSGLYTDIIDMQEEKSDYASSKDFTQNWSNYLVQNSVFQNATKIPDKLDILGNKIYKQYDLSPIVTDFDFMFSYKELPKEMKDVYDYASKNNIYLGGRSIKGYFNYEVKEAMKKEETAKLLKDLYKKTEGNIPNDANFENAVKVLLRNELKVRYGKFLEEYVKNKQYENLPIEMQQENVLSALKDIKDMVWIEKGISTD